MKLVDIEELKKEYKKALVNNLIDKDRGIDLSEHAEIPSNYFNKFLDDLSAMDVLDKIVIEISNLDNLNPNYLSTGIYMVDKTRVLQIIDKYKTGK